MAIVFRQRIARPSDGPCLSDAGPLEFKLKPVGTFATLTR